MTVVAVYLVRTSRITPCLPERSLLTDHTLEFGPDLGSPPQSRSQSTAHRQGLLLEGVTGLSSCRAPSCRIYVGAYTSP